MSDEICPHGDVLAACLDCTLFPPDPKPVRPVAGRYAFTAEFSGECPECSVPIEPGLRIAAMTDGTYRHFGCVDRWTVDD